MLVDRPRWRCVYEVGWSFCARTCRRHFRSVGVRGCRGDGLRPLGAVSHDSNRHQRGGRGESSRRDDDQCAAGHLFRSPRDRQYESHADNPWHRRRRGDNYRRRGQGPACRQGDTGDWHRHVHRLDVQAWYDVRHRRGRRVPGARVFARLRGLHVRAQYGLRRRGRSANHVQRDLYQLHDSQQFRRALWRRRVHRFGLASCLHRMRHPGQCLWHRWCRRRQPRRRRRRVLQRRVADIPVLSCQRQHVEVCRRRHFPHGRPRLRFRPGDADRGRHRSGRQRLEPVPRRAESRGGRRHPRRGQCDGDPHARTDPSQSRRHRRRSQRISRPVRRRGYRHRCEPGDRRVWRRRLCVVQQFVAAITRERHQSHDHARAQQHGADRRRHRGRGGQLHEPEGEPQRRELSGERQSIAVARRRDSRESDDPGPLRQPDHQQHRQWDRHSVRGRVAGDDDVGCDDHLDDLRAQHLRPARRRHFRERQQHVQHERVERVRQYGWHPRRAVRRPDGFGNRSEQRHCRQRRSAGQRPDSRGWLQLGRLPEQPDPWRRR